MFDIQYNNSLPDKPQENTNKAEDRLFKGTSNDSDKPTDNTSKEKDISEEDLNY